MADKVKISDSTSTTSSVIAASLTAVKAAMDKANSAAVAASNAQTTASNAVSTANSASTTATNAYNLANSKQANLGFTPVQQGGGANQGTNKIYLGWDGGLRCQVDATDLGQIITTNAGKTSVSWADGAWSATVTPNVVTGKSNNHGIFYLPSGGTWTYIVSDGVIGTQSGGSYVEAYTDGYVNYMTIRTS